MNVLDERCIPWDPIPREYNRLSDLYITDFGEADNKTSDAVVCTIRSFLLGDALERDHSWRISFAPLAYRLRPVGNWPEALPMTWPPTSWTISGTGQVALWELTSSVYLAQSVAPSMRNRVHHYVLMNHDMAYEVIALSYRIEDLGVSDSDLP